ncbi:MAG TPA: nicotinate-nucleotide--dimethylbenzimidazole phosphoribosyltransferase, partial [Polyangia bacterium]
MSEDDVTATERDLITPEAPFALPEATRQAIYDVMALRRDVRHFDPDRSIDDAVLTRILGAAHLAPSVGFSQPWHFIVIGDRAIRTRVRESFLACRAAEAARYPVARREAYLRHRLEGILEAPLNLCVAVDLRDRGEAILGTTVQPEAVRASACCAVQNLWLAARAEGIGLGWVSIVEPAVLRAELGLPAGVEPVAYLCLGHPRAFRARPMLDETGWATRRPLADVVHRDHFPRETKAVPPVHTVTTARAASAAKQATLVKPRGSLGRLEELAARYAGARREHPAPVPERAALALFAADHGVAAEGVSAYGSATTAAMIATIMTGGAAINALVQQNRIDLSLIDVGVAGDLSALPRTPLVPLVRDSIRAGTRNLLREAALTRAEVDAALAVGATTAHRLIDDGADLLGVGELGIANTTAAAALIALFTRRSPQEIVGRGTGLDDAGVGHKIAVIEAALARAAVSPADPTAALAEVGGLEIAAMVGFLRAACQRQRPVVLDGFVTNAAALVACALAPEVADSLIASHRSAERGAGLALEVLGLAPLFDLQLRLGEGTGAALGMALVRSAVAAESGMATFATAGIWPR